MKQKVSVIIGALILSACGGGGGESNTNTQPPTTQPPITTPPTTSPPLTNPPTTQPPVDSPALPPLGSILTSLKIVEAGNQVQTNVPITFGQVFSKGHIPSSSSLTATINGTQIPLQVNVKATHDDGSVRHAIISAIMPQLNSTQSADFALASTSMAPSTTGTTPTVLLGAGFTAEVSATLGGQTYTASADKILATGSYKTWISGPIVNEWIVEAPLKTSSGVEHPHLFAKFAIRSYTNTNKVRVDVTVENDWAYEPNPQNITYDAQIKVGGNAVYTRNALNHYHHARWRKIFWWGTETPNIHIAHDKNYLMETKAVPKYDPTVTISESGLASLQTAWNNKPNGPMDPGIVTAAMPMAGGRGDIAPLPEWTALYLMSMDKRARNITLGVGDLAGSWPIHYRDKNTGLPVSLNDYPYMTLLGNPGDTINPATNKSEAFPNVLADPTCTPDPNVYHSCTSHPYNYDPDSAHQPSMAYVPYLVTGDYYYLEELMFWANWNMIQYNPYYRSFEKGILKADQVRGQAWSLRTLAQTAYIAPDSHPMKSYFVARVNNNLDWYNTTYSVGNPNQLGIIDGSGQYGFESIAYTTPSGAQTGVSTWQDDFFTWSVGNAYDLGFTNALSLLQWKSKFPIGRMTAQGYCWIDGATYALTVRPNNTSPLFTTFEQVYLATMKNPDGSEMINSTGKKYLDQQCGSQAQADWRTQSDKDNNITRTPWAAGEMTGYAYSYEGYPSNMQPALAVAANSGMPNAQNAWNTFITRAVKPDYSSSPQWAIVPR